LATEPDNPANRAKTGRGLSDQRVRAELRAALSRIPGDIIWAVPMFNFQWIAGLVAFHFLK